MTTWTDELKKIRRAIRDPDGKIWTDQFLQHMWNDVQQDFQSRTSVLENVLAQRVPDLYHMSYMHDWEWHYLPTDITEFYQCLSRHSGNTFMHLWEPQQVATLESFATTTTTGSGSTGYYPPGFSPPGFHPPGYFPGSSGGTTTHVAVTNLADVSDPGAHFTQPWEAFMLTPGEEVRMKFPRDMGSIKFIAYDEQSILQTTRKLVQSNDPSHITRTGRSFAYYQHESQDKTYVLYPRPDVAFANEIAGDGMAFFVAGDTNSTAFGTVAVRHGSNETEVSGASVDIVEAEDNVFLVYNVSPLDISSDWDEIEFPEYLRRYVRFGVVSRAYDAETDGRIPSLAKLWGDRYRLGVDTVKRFVRNRRQDRDYRLTTKSPTRHGRRKYPRLPSTYPNVNP